MNSNWRSTEFAKTLQYDSKIKNFLFSGWFCHFTPGVLFLQTATINLLAGYLFRRTIILRFTLNIYSLESVTRLLKNSKSNFVESYLDITRLHYLNLIIFCELIDIQNIRVQFNWNFCESEKVILKYFLGVFYNFWQQISECNSFVNCTLGGFIS